MDDVKRYITLKEWADEDKPREKLLTQGKKQLSNAELLAILIRSGVHGHSALDVAKDIMAEARNNLSEVATMSVSDIMEHHKGIGEAKAITIVAALELGYRLLSEKSNHRDVVVKNSQQLFEFIAPSLADLQEEEFWLMFLNSRNKITDKQRLSHGGLSETTVDLRVVFREALRSGAVAIALAHNHPSGNISPSERDRGLTHNICEAAKLLRINVLDHIIVSLDSNGHPCYYSFFDHGILR